MGDTFPNTVHDSETLSPGRVTGSDPTNSVGFQLKLQELQHTLGESPMIPLVTDFLKLALGNLVLELAVNSKNLCVEMALPVAQLGIRGQAINGSV